MNAKKLSFVSLIILVLIVSACGPSLPNQAALATPVPTPTAVEGTPLTEVKYSAKGVLDVYMPEGQDGPFPTLLLIPAAINFRWDYKNVAEYLAGQGYAIVTADWGPPGQRRLQEAFCSLAWIHASAERYGFDAKRIAVFGHSEGALMAATIGAIDDAGPLLEGCPHQLPESGWTKGIVTYSGVYGTQGWALSDTFFQGWWQAGTGQTTEQSERMFEAMRSTPYRQWRQIEGLDETAANAIRAFPLTWVDGSEPPFRVIHGDKEQTWDIKDAEAFVFEMQALGGDAKLQVLSEAGHEDIVRPASASFQEILDAIDTDLAELFE